MAKISATKLREEAKKPITAKLLDFCKAEFDEDAALVADNAFMFPIVDANGGEWYAKVTVAIPIGENHGAIPYDGYEDAQNYQREKAEKEEREKAKAEEKARKIERDRKAREAKEKAKAEREAKANAEKGE